MNKNAIHHIVIADDDEDDFEFFKTAVEKTCPQVELSYAPNWMDLLKYLNKTTLPDVIFLDLNMPVKNGIECLRAIRAEKRFDEIAVIIYSTSGSDGDVEESYKQKANFYVIKPDKENEIVRILEMICSMDKKVLQVQPDKSLYVLNRI